MSVGSSRRTFRRIARPSTARPDSRRSGLAKACFQPPLHVLQNELGRLALGHAVYGNVKGAHGDVSGSVGSLETRPGFWWELLLQTKPAMNRERGSLGTEHFLLCWRHSAVGEDDVWATSLNRCSGLNFEIVGRNRPEHLGKSLLADEAQQHRVDSAPIHRREGILFHEHPR